MIIKAKITKPHREQEKRSKKDGKAKWEKFVFHFYIELLPTL